MDPRVINADGLWYMPEEKDLIKVVYEVDTNVLTALRDDVDPICDGSVVRCLLCRTEKVDEEIALIGT